MPTLNYEQHACRHCGTSFEGNHCPQCGLSGNWERFTLRSLINGFLDIWGMGNRPMFRSMRDLMYRPGHMIRDYLNGHYLSYFPPFKMLAILTLFMALLSWITGITPQDSNTDNALHDFAQTHKYNPIWTYTYWILDYFSSHDLQRLLIQNLAVVTAVWLSFRKKKVPTGIRRNSRSLNMVETFYEMIYINCQFLILGMAIMIITWDFPEAGILPYPAHGALTLLVLMFDFKQLYGLNWTKTFLRIFLMLLLVILIYLILTVIIILVGAIAEVMVT